MNAQAVLNGIMHFCQIHPILATMIGIGGFPEVEIIVAVIALAALATR